MTAPAKWLIAAGAILVLLGLLWQAVGRFIPFGRLPGDVAVDGENFSLRFPIVTCLVLSALLTLIANVAARFFK